MYYTTLLFKLNHRLP